MNCLFDLSACRILKIKDLAIKNNVKIISIESCTSGLIAACLTSIAGSSKFFESCMVTYSVDSKISLLNIDRNLIKKHGVVSGYTALLMSLNAIHKFNNLKNSIVIATTGVIGPDKLEKKEVGLVYIACLYKINDKFHSKVKNFIFHDNSRLAIRNNIVLSALDILIPMLSF